MKEETYTEEEKQKLQSLHKKFDVFLPLTMQDCYHYLASKNKLVNKLKDDFDLKFR